MHLTLGPQPRARSFAPVAGLCCLQRLTLRSSLYPGISSRRAVLVQLIGEKEDKISSKEQEDQTAFFLTEGEKKGKSPATDPLAVIGILAILAPFIAVLVGVQQGWLDTSHYSR